MAIPQIVRTGPNGLRLKAWVLSDPAAGGVIKGANVASCVRSAAGTYVVTFTTAMATALYVVHWYNSDAPNTNTGIQAVMTSAKAVGSANLATMRLSAANYIAADWTSLYLEFWE